MIFIMLIKRCVKLLAVVAVLLAGGITGGFAAFSYCAGQMPLYQFSADLPAMAITEKNEVVIQENKALKDAVAKVKDAVVAVKISDAKGGIIYGSGLALTSDGLVAVPYNLYLPQAPAEIFSRGEKISFEVVKRDKAENLVILKLESANWLTSGFYQMENLKLGERVFLAGAAPDGGNFVNEGIVRDFTEDAITTNIYERDEALGAAVFDIEGNILGIADIDKTGQISVIPISKIKEISGL